MTERSEDKNSEVVVIGIGGGSASGKTLVTQRLLEALPHDDVAFLRLDDYYRNFAHLDDQARATINFDHPQAFDIDLIADHLEALRRNEDIETPIYDYTTHMRSETAREVKAQPIIVIEGILVFYFERLRELMNIRIFVETAPDLRLLRRIRRDIIERGRKIEDVLEQYERDVRPMHEAFVEPSKRWADLIVPHGGENQVAIDLLRAQVLRRRFEGNNA